MGWTRRSAACAIYWRRTYPHPAHPEQVLLVQVLQVQMVQVQMAVLERVAVLKLERRPERQVRLAQRPCHRTVLLQRLEPGIQRPRRRRPIKMDPRPEPEPRPERVAGPVRRLRRKSLPRLRAKRQWPDQMSSRSTTDHRVTLLHNPLPPAKLLNRRRLVPNKA